MKNKYTRTFLILLLLLALDSLQAQVDKKFISNNVLKVIVNYDNGQESATGFLWKDKTTLVTSYHVVKDGYKSITVQDVFGWKASAKVSQVYKPADLMLLEITSTPGDDWVAFTEANEMVAEGEKTKAYGYNGTASGIVPITLEKTDPIPGGTLYYAIPREDREAIKALGFPSLKLPIMYLLGGLLPGYSGSPILNKEGKLVAIGDGGLNKGTTNSSWGIPAENLFKLSSANLDLASSRSTRLFSSGSSSPSDKSLNKAEYKLDGGEDFFYTRTVKLIDIIDASDDPKLLLGLLELYKDFNFGLEEIEFEVYQEVTSNYVVTVPKGSEIETVGNFLRITAFDDNLYATFTPGGVVKNSLEEFVDWASQSSDANISLEIINKEEFQTTSDGVMRFVSMLEYEGENADLTKLWHKKGLKVHNNTAYIRSRTWLKDLDSEAFIQCYTSNNGANCSAAAKERVKIALISDIMMRLTTIANTQVLYIDPLKDVVWAQQNRLPVSFPASLEITEVTDVLLTASEPSFNMSLQAETLAYENDFDGLINFMNLWASKLPDWTLIEESLTTEVVDVNGFNAAFGFYETGQPGLNALLFSAYKDEEPRKRYSWIVIFGDDKFDTVNEMIRRFGK